MLLNIKNDHIVLIWEHDNIRERMRISFINVPIEKYFILLTADKMLGINEKL